MSLLYPFMPTFGGPHQPFIAMNPQMPIPPLHRAPTRKPPQVRSKGGCRTCKEKKKGCDRNKPICGRCAERCIECIYDPPAPRKQSRPRAAAGGSSSDLVGAALQSAFAFSSNSERRSTSETASTGSSPESMTSDTTPDPGSFVEHFCEHLAPLLVFRDYANPFVEEVLPLRDDDRVLRNAICLLAEAHQKRTIQSTEPQASEFYTSVIQGLSKSIHRQACYQDSKLAVNVLLCYFEMIQNSALSASNVEIHLKGALQIILPGITQKTAATEHLEKTLYFFDVLHSLATGSKPVASDLNLHRPPISLSQPHTYSHVDPVFGLAMDLWPLLRRLALVTNLKKRLNTYGEAIPGSRSTSVEPMVEPYDVLSQDYEDRKREVWAQLRVWQPPAVSLNSGPAYYTSQLQSLVTHAEACRTAAMIHMTREVYELPTMSAQVQTRAKAVLESCICILDANGPTVGLVWPLFVASLELVDPSDISNAQAAFSRLHNKRHANNIFSAWTVCQEVWRRRSTGVAQSHWRQVAIEMGVTIVFG